MKLPNVKGMPPHWLSSVLLSLPFGLAIYGKFQDVAIACAVFTAMQFIIMGYMQLAQIANDMQELVLYSRVRFDLEHLKEAIKTMEDAAEHHRRERG